MKNKFLIVLLVSCVVLLALLGALAVLPHAHGGDFNHATHQSCPVYQFSLHSVDFNFQAAALVAVIFSLIFLKIREFASPRSIFFFTASLRAPPASS